MTGTCGNSDERAMATPETEIVVEDPTAPSDNSPSVVSTRTVDIVVSLLLLALAALLCFDNWRTGIAWAPDGPQPGYFPFYLGIILAAASLYGLITSLVTGAGAAQIFLTRDQLRRVMQVFVPTLLFCLFTQWLGLYVASFLLIAGFMWIIGRIALWKSVLTAFLFAIIMFVTFDVAFDVIMPKGPLEAAFGYEASAPNPKFAQIVLQGRLRTPGSKGRWNLKVAGVPLIPKFASEGCAKVCELRNRDASRDGSLRPAASRLHRLADVEDSGGDDGRARARHFRRGIAGTGRAEWRRDPTAAHVHDGSDLGHRHALLHLLGRSVRRRHHLDPIQHPGRGMVRGDHLRRLPDGAAGPSGRGVDRGLYLVVHRFAGGRPADHVSCAGHCRVRAAVWPTGILRGLSIDVLLVRRPRPRGQA